MGISGFSFFILCHPENEGPHEKLRTEIRQSYVEFRLLSFVPQDDKQSI